MRRISTIYVTEEDIGARYESPCEPDPIEVGAKRAGFAIPRRVLD